MLVMTGYNEVMTKLINMGISFNPLVEETTNIVMHKTQDLAMKTLESKLGSGRWGGVWSHGAPVVHIGDAWKHTNGSWITGTYTIELSNVSDHAAAVEFGVPGYIKPKSAYNLYLGDGTYKRWVRGQAGYHYLTEAMEKTDELQEVYTKMMRDFLHYYSI